MLQVDGEPQWREDKSQSATAQRLVGLGMAGSTSLADLLRNHLERIEIQVARTTLLRDRLRNMTTDGEVHVSVDELPATLNAMSRVEKRAQAPRCRCASDPTRGERWRRIHEELRDGMTRGEHPCERVTAGRFRRVR